MVIEDKCSGAIPFFEREGGKRIEWLIQKGGITSLSVSQIDRLGRSLHDIINTIQFFYELKIPIEFISQGLRTIDGDGKQNPISKMIIPILGVVAEMERTQIKERQKEGIHVAKLRGNILVGKLVQPKGPLIFCQSPKIRKHWSIYERDLKNRGF